MGEETGKERDPLQGCIFRLARVKGTAPDRTFEEPYEIHLKTICTLDKRGKRLYIGPHPHLSKAVHRCQLPAFPGCTCVSPKVESKR